MTAISRRSLVAAAAAIALTGEADRAQSAPPEATRVALKGYDPVSYFTDGGPERGSSQYTYAFDDTTYWFKSAEHKALFAGDPAHYAPQFDGYCAVMMSRGIKTEADPTSWAIKDGKLYVFGMKAGMANFREHGTVIAEKASVNWPKLRNAH